ncbi:hypothetical protein GGD46_002128 [Rhizobium lusitanum]|uniref:Uncharacterized protein n=1 Tax=Rhizobium lusitanum TaxID=293958 RepID=A0A7X0IPN3_9HYPH|nr:hypothetical protein [Rhizobium lusitanum]
MSVHRRSRRPNFHGGGFDHFWGCPICHRTLSIAEVIELHCEGCNATVNPTETFGPEFATAQSRDERSA